MGNFKKCVSGERKINTRQKTIEHSETKKSVYGNEQDKPQSPEE